MVVLGIGAVVALGLLVVVAWALCSAAGRADRQIEAIEVERRQRVFPRGACSKCGEIVPLRADGQPSRRWHACTIPLCPRCRAPKPCACQEAA